MGIDRKSKVTLFLQLFKNIACSDRSRFVFAPRVENRDTITRLGLTIDQAKDMILELTSEDYFNGPSVDLNHKDREIWEFGKNIDGTEVYIKLQTCKIETGGVAICISFHEANKTINYPYKAKN